MANMTIIDERKITTTTAEEVDVGEIFVFDGECLIMTDDCDDIVAVNLETGERKEIHCCEKVVLVNATLTIN